MRGHVDKSTIVGCVLISVVEVAPVQWKLGEGLEPQRRFDAKEHRHKC